MKLVRLLSAKKILQHTNTSYLEIILLWNCEVGAKKARCYQYCLCEKNISSCHLSFIDRLQRADRLASTADITSGLQLGRADALKSLRSFLNMDRPEHHSIDRLKERGVEKGSGQHSTLQDRERSVFNQANIGTVLRTTLWRLLRKKTSAATAAATTKLLLVFPTEKT